MDTSSRQRWVGRAVVVGATYFVIGRVFTWPTDHLGAWRLAAWVVNGAVYGIHITVLARLYLSGFDQYYVGLLFWSLGATAAAYLWLRSGYVPRALAAFGILASA